MSDQEPRKRSWTTAILLTSSIIVTLLFLMYAFVQEAEADVQRKMAEKYRMDAYNESQKCADARKRLNDSLAVLQLKLNNLENANGSKRK